MRTPTVNAPGVLSNDTDVEDANLTAVLVNGPSHGTLDLNRRRFLHLHTG